MNSTTKLPINTEAQQVCQQCKKTVLHLKMNVIDGKALAICTECADLNKSKIQMVTYNVTDVQVPVRYKDTIFWKGYNVAAKLNPAVFIVYGGVAWVAVAVTLEYIRTHPDNYFTAEKPIKSVEMLDENLYHGKFKITLTDGTVTLLPYVNASNIRKLTGYVAEPTESLPYAEPLKLGVGINNSSSNGTCINFTDQAAYNAAVTDGIALKGFFSNKINPNRKGKLMFQTGLKDTCHQIVVTTKTSVYTIPIRIAISNVFQDALHIVSVDTIDTIDGGTVVAPTYADAAAIIATLPTTVTALSGAVNIPVLAWHDVDTYNASVAKVYKFRGTLAPNARLKVEPTVVTISVNLKHDIVAFDAIEDVFGSNTVTITFEDAAAVIAALPTEVTADAALVTVPVTTWVDTDTYNPAVVGSYTFTATLGALPTNVVNTTNATATIEVVVTEA